MTVGPRGWGGRRGRGAPRRGRGGGGGRAGGRARVAGATRLGEGGGAACAAPPQEGARLMVIAKDGKQAKKAASRLIDEGYDAVAVDGDMDDWVSENFQVQPTPDPDE